MGSGRAGEAWLSPAGRLRLVDEGLGEAALARLGRAVAELSPEGPAEGGMIDEADLVPNRMDGERFAMRTQPMMRLAQALAVDEMGDAAALLEKAVELRAGHRQQAGQSLRAEIGRSHVLPHDVARPVDENRAERGPRRFLIHRLRNDAGRDQRPGRHLEIGGMLGRDMRQLPDQAVDVADEQGCEILAHLETMDTVEALL